jgi:hypothetical protein
MAKPVIELVPELKAVASALARDRRVVHFKSTSLCYDDKVFAMIVKGDLVLKLPAARVTELIAKRLGHPYDPGSGKMMKEWVAFSPSKKSRWVALAKESRDFLAGSKYVLRKQIP